MLENLTSSRASDLLKREGSDSAGKERPMPFNQRHSGESFKKNISLNNVKSDPDFPNQSFGFVSMLNQYFKPEKKKSVKRAHTSQDKEKLRLMRFKSDRSSKDKIKKRSRGREKSKWDYMNYNHEIDFPSCNKSMHSGGLELDQSVMYSQSMNRSKMDEATFLG